MSARRVPQHPGLPSPGDVEAVLRRHVLDAWFPRCLDLDQGGFRCDFDRAWRERGPHDKFLEFQARQTMLAAESALAFPRDPGLRAATLHGFRFLKDRLWDREYGGWFHRLDRAGAPLEAETKHSHGAAYAIEASVAVYQATGEREALDHALEGFEWLERCAHDQRHGGYFGFLTRDGRPITEPDRTPWKTSVDTIGTEIGIKDANVHSDLLETLVVLYRAAPETRVEARLTEVLDIICNRMTVAATGAMHIFALPDWTPLPHLARSGYQAQGAFRVSEAVGLVGDSAQLRQSSERLLDHALRYFHDPIHGGFFYGGPGSDPLWFEDYSLVVRWKPWWIEGEILKALIAIGSNAADPGRYLDHAASLWRYIERNLLDHRHGGFYARGLDTVRRRRRWMGPALAPANVTRKGDVWKDGSHEGRALLYCLAALGGPGS